jgi:hypothetical protein
MIRVAADMPSYAGPAAAFPAVPLSRPLARSLAFLIPGRRP